MNSIAGWSNLVARKAHILQVGSASLPPATTEAAVVKPGPRRDAASVETSDHIRPAAHKTTKQNV